MKYIITGIKKHGKKTRLYFWSKENSTYLDVELPAIFPSRPLNFTGENSIESAMLGLQSINDGTNILFKRNLELKLASLDNSYDQIPMDSATLDDIIPLSKDKGVMQIIAPSDLKKKMRSSGLDFAFEIIKENDSRHNLSRIARMQVGWPFSYASLDGGVYFLHQKPTLDELMALPCDAFDSEFEGWEKSFKFDDLDVSSDILSSYLSDAIPRHIISLETNLRQLSEMDEKEHDTYAEEFDGLTKKQEMSLSSSKEDLGSLNGISWADLIHLASKYKFLEEEYNPFGISYVAPTLGNFYFSIYPLIEEQSEISTGLGGSSNKQLFSSFVIDDISKLDSVFAKLKEVCGNDYAKNLENFYSENKDKVKDKFDAITFLFAITKRAYNAVISGGANINSYDFPNIRDEKKGSLFLSGFDGQAPYHDANLQFFKRFIEPGRHNLDSVLLFQKYMAGTIDNKLKTTISHLFGLHDTKDMTYDDLTRKRIEASLGNRKSAQEIATYCVKDALLSFQATQALKKPIFLLSNLLMQSPEVVSSTSYKNISLALIQSSSLRRRGTYLSTRFGEFSDLKSAGKNNNLIFINPNNGNIHIPQKGVKYDDFSVEDEKNGLLFTTDNSMDLSTRTLFSSKPGLYSCLLFYLTPFVKGLWHYVQKNSSALNIIEEMKSLSKLDDRVSRNQALILAQGLQKDFLASLVFPTLNYSPTRGLSKIDKGAYHPDAFVFEKTFGKSLSELNNSIADARNDFQELIARYEVSLINSKTLTALLVPYNVKDEFKSELFEKRLGIYYADAQVLSLFETGKFLINIHGDMMTQGIDAKFTRGLKNPYESRFNNEFLRYAFNGDNYAAAKLVKDAVAKIRSGKIDINDLLYSENSSKKDPQEYSSLAIRSRKILNKILNGVQKEESSAWVYTKDGIVNWPFSAEQEYDPGMYLKVMFGEERKKKWHFTNYHFDNPISVSESTAHTSCGGLVEAVLVYSAGNPLALKAKREALIRIVKGKEVGDELVILGGKER